MYGGCCCLRNGLGGSAGFATGLGASGLGALGRGARLESVDSGLESVSFLNHQLDQMFGCHLAKGYHASMMASQSQIGTVQQFMEAVWALPKPNALQQRLYRGQSNDWPLLPRLFRLTERSKDELRLVERQLLDMFRERCLHLLPSFDGNHAHLMSMAQHFGLTTRLLDWSSNPLIALFFAVAPLHPPAPTVYICDGIRYNVPQPPASMRVSPEPNAPEIMRPARHSHRVVAQAGWHTWHSDEGTDMRGSPNEPIDALSIVPSQTRSIRNELKDMGIEAATVYGDLNSICREIEIDLELKFEG
jgi:hypothetical protein